MKSIESPFLDFDKKRTDLYTGVQDAIAKRYPISNSMYTLSVSDLHYTGPETFTKKQQKDGIMTSGSPGRPLRGKLSLTDNATGEVVSSKSTVLVHTPYLTERGTVIYNGNEYTIANQQRLRSGVYTRLKDSGEASAHFNVLSGGPSFETYLDPESGKFFMNLGQAKIPLYSVLRTAGVTDQEMGKWWGEGVLNENRTPINNRAIARLYTKLLPRGHEGPKPELNLLLGLMQLDKGVTQKTLGTPYDTVTPETILRASQKLLRITKGEEQTDDRSSLLYQDVWEPVKLLQERIEKDAGNVLKNTFNKIANRRDVHKYMSGLHDKHVLQLLFKSGVSMPLEEINPLDAVDQNLRLTRMGEGGILTSEQVPLEARNVQPSQYSFVDPVRTPECYDEHTMVYTSDGWKFWNEVDGRTRYAVLINSRVAFKPSYALMKYKYDGIMYGLKTGQLDLLVTPEHRLWVSLDGDNRRLHYVTGVCDDEMTFTGRHGFFDSDRFTFNADEVVEYLLDNERFPDNFRLADGSVKLDVLNKLCRESKVPIDDIPLDVLRDTLALFADVGIPARVKGYCLETWRSLFRVRARSWFREMYNGNVYCATVPGGLLYVKRNEGFPVWCGNSGNVGVDTRAALNTSILNGVLQTTVRDRFSGKTVQMSPDVLMNEVVAFPGEFERAKREGRNVVVTMKGGQMQYTDPAEVRFETPSGYNMFTLGSAFVPGFSAVKGGRLMMGAKSINSAMPLRDPEAPLVQGLYDGDTSIEEMTGKYVGAMYSDVGGVVSRVTDRFITLTGIDGKEKQFEMYRNFPQNRKSYINNTPVVQVGDIVTPGKLLAKSNYTDDKGVVALGKNLITAYMAYPGNHEDGITISESAAQKLSSDNMYLETRDSDTFTKVEKAAFMGKFPVTFTQEQLRKVDDNGVVKVGQVLDEGDPIILATSQLTSKGEGMLQALGRKGGVNDSSSTWDHDTQGTVTDVWRDEKGSVKVAIQTYVPIKVGSKITGRFGDKGVVANIIEDAKMPTDGQGNVIDVMFNPLGLPTRVNPEQIIEAVLGKVAHARGRAYKVPPFLQGNATEMAIAELEKAGLTDTETVHDPVLNRSVKDILVGRRFFTVQPHTAESKESAREFGGYSSSGAPAGGESGENPKKVGWGELNALISHGAINVIRDLKEVKGQENSEYWKAVMMGYTPPVPGIPLQYKKFLSMLKAAGINIKRQGDQMNLLAMTDRDTDEVTSGEIKKPDTVKWLQAHGKGLRGEKGMAPVDGGLFDRGVTGGHGGNRWSHVKAFEPLPQIVMLDTIRDLLGLTKQQTEDLYSGSYSLKDFGTGPAAMQKALGAVNVTREYQTQLQALKTAGTLSAKDAIVRRLKALRGLKDTGISPADLMISKVPVLPPIFRPITVNNKFDIVSDANVLYKDYMIANENLKEASKVLPDSELVEYRRNCMNTYGALVGLMDPVRAQHKNMGVRGLLGEVFGSGPKQSMFQKRLLGTQSDLASRSVVVSNHNLNMDQIGIPEDHAWKLYNPFVVRALVKRAGANRDARTWALDQVEKRTDMARTALDIAMKEMPVLATRAPALHRYSMMGFEPVIVPGKAFHVNPSVMAGLNCDCDGDAVLNKVFAIVPETVYNTDIALQHKEVRMSAYFKTNVVAIGEGKRLILVDLEDFPHNKGCLTKDHIDFYTVPEGIDVLAMDEATGRVTATPVSHWSVHHDREIEIVTLTGGRQIITDDDPRAVYGLDIDTFTWCRRRPSEAGRIMVPVVTNDTSQWEQTASIDLPRNCTDRLVDTLPLTFDIGYAFGSTVGDGWVNGMEGSKQISIANSDPKIHQEWSRAMTEFFREPPKVGYLDPGMEGKFANAKHVFRSTVSSAALATAFGEWIGRGSKQKHLPPFTWSAPTEFKLGLLSGLLDTDGSIIISHSKAKLQYSVSYYSSSIRLVQEVQHLCRTLGVMTHIGSYKAPGGGDAWLVSISGPDVIKGLSGVRLFSEERAKRLEAMRSNPPKSNGRALGRRLMPMPPWLADELCKLIPSSVNKYSTVFMARGKGHMSKAGALDILEYLESNGLVCNHPLFGMWQNLVKQDYYHFERVKKVDKTGVKETGYDLTVPGFETFMSLDGIILSNTMAAHMVVSSKAADEVRRKMLASTNLRSPSDFGAHMTPRQEFLLGLYIASQAKGGKYHKFGTKQEAINAFKRGEVDLKDNVVIGT